MVEFIVENHELIILLLACLLDLVLFLVGFFRRGKMTSNLYCDVFRLLPFVISKAEKIYGSGKGEEKLSYVISVIRNCFIKETGKEPTRSEYALIRQMIEKILETPTKKGK